MIDITIECTDSWSPGKGHADCWVVFSPTVLSAVSEYWMAILEMNGSIWRSVNESQLTVLGEQLGGRVLPHLYKYIYNLRKSIWSIGATKYIQTDMYILLFLRVLLMVFFLQLSYHVCHPGVSICMFCTPTSIFSILMYMPRISDQIQIQFLICGVHYLLHGNRTDNDFEHKSSLLNESDSEEENWLKRTRFASIIGINN